MSSSPPVFPVLADVASRPDESHLLGSVLFGVAPGASEFSIPLPQLQQPPMRECWMSGTEVRHQQIDGVGVTSNEEVAFLTLSYATRDDVEVAAAEAYRRLVSVAAQAGFPSFVRIWNHLSRINVIESSLERYQAFCRGRHDALESSGYRMREDLPAASAVGASETGLWVHALASKKRARQVENPRQMSAYEYPSQYGPRSPSFSRASVIEWPGETQVYLSGTASIVGHESRHHGDVGAQTDETLSNMDVVLKSAGVSGLESLAYVKAYVRDTGDAGTVVDRVSARIPHAPLLVLHSDICRAELLVEIEGVARVANR